MRSTTLLITAMIIAATLVSGALVGYDSASAQGTALPGTTGTTVTVNTKVDESNTDGDCSLREAIEAANTNAKVDRCKAGSATEEDAIYFALGEKAKIVLGSQLPTITDASGLTIDGQKAKITVSGNDAVRVFEVGSSAAVNLRKLKVADGNSDDFGGGAFNNAGGTLTVTKSTFSGNSATDLGGGIDNRGTLEVTNSTFSANKTTRADGNNFGGGIFNDGTLKVSKSTFSNNSSLQGGGLANFRTLEVTNSTFSANTAAGGGGIFTNDTLKVANSTFSGNSSTQLSGGAIRNQEQLGPFPGAGATVTLSNTIVANSPSGGNCGGPIIDGGFNVDDGTTCGFSAANISEPSTDPLLGLLANNGGPTKTHALLRGSPAIDAIPDGTNGCGTLINTDQRGVERPQGSRCDIGAYEKKVRSR
jgi:CSLREA domain-containing protein